MKKIELPLRLVASEWIGLYAFLHKYSDATLADHPYHLTLCHYLHSIPNTTPLRWALRRRHSPGTPYTSPLPLHIAVILWHEMQNYPLTEDTQRTLTKLDHALINAGFKPPRQ